MSMGGQEEREADPFCFIAPVIQVTEQFVIRANPMPEEGWVGMVRGVWEGV